MISEYKSTNIYNIENGKHVDYYVWEEYSPIGFRDVNMLVLYDNQTHICLYDFHTDNKPLNYGVLEMRYSKFITSHNFEYIITFEKKYIVIQHPASKKNKKIMGEYEFGVFNINNTRLLLMGEKHLIFTFPQMEILYELNMNLKIPTPAYLEIYFNDDYLTDGITVYNLKTMEKIYNITDKHTILSCINDTDTLISFNPNLNLINFRLFSIQLLIQLNYKITNYIKI